jgi:hypothetical protein
MPAEPSVRASLVKMVLRRAAELWPGDAAAFEAALGPGGLERLARTPGHDWAPFTLEVAIVRTVHERHGDEGARRLGREIGRVGVENAILRPVVAATVGMLGRRPAALAAVVASCWPVATRNAGRVIASAPRHGEVHFTHQDVPEGLRDRGMAFRNGGSAEGVLELAGLMTSLEVEWAAGSPWTRMRVAWRRPGATP